MRTFFLVAVCFVCLAGRAQIIITQTVDTLLYNVLSYVPVGVPQRQVNSTYVLMYTNTTNPTYKMKKAFLDSAGTKILSKTFYHQNQMDGPYESYQMDKLLAKGTYKNGKLDGERLTYFANGVVMEKASFKNGKRSGVWEYRNTEGILKWRVTYGNNGQITLDEHF